MVVTVPSKKRFRKTPTRVVSRAAADAGLAKKLAKLERIVRQMQPEVKFADVGVSGTNVPVATGLVTLMSSIASGSGVNQRIGEHVRVVGWELNFEAAWTSSITAGVTDNSTYRFYVVQDTQQIGSTSPTGADLVDQPSLPSVQLLQVTEQKRFKILYDSKPQTPMLGIPSGTAAINTLTGYHPVKNIKRKCNIRVEFNSTAATNIQKNGIYLFVFSDMVTGGGASVFDYAATSRLLYTDV